MDDKIECTLNSVLSMLESSCIPLKEGRRRRIGADLVLLSRYRKGDTVWDIISVVNRHPSVRSTFSLIVRFIAWPLRRHPSVAVFLTKTRKRTRAQEETLLRGKTKEPKKHTAASIRWSSPTQLLISRSEAYLWLSGREAEFSTVCGRMCINVNHFDIYSKFYLVTHLWYGTGEVKAVAIMCHFQWE